MQILDRSSTTNTSSKPNRDIKFIVIHYTAGVSSKPNSAVNTAAWFAKASAKASADFIVDDSAVVQFNGDIRNRYSWHCGGSKVKSKGGSLYKVCTNANSIGIELCSSNRLNSASSPANDKSWYYTDAAVCNAVALVKDLCKEFKIPAENVIRHYDVTGKLCPGIVGWNADSGSEAEWEAFKAQLTDSSVEDSYKARYTELLNSFNALQSELESYKAAMQAIKDSLI